MCLFSAQNVKDQGQRSKMKVTGRQIPPENDAYLGSVFTHARSRHIFLVVGGIDGEICVHAK